MVSIITLLLLISSLKAETQTLQLNSIIVDSIKSYQMKYYSIELDKNLKDNDLLIDSRMTETKSFHAPLTLVSLVSIFNTRILYLMIIRKSNGYADNLEKKFASFLINIYRLDKRYILALHVINVNIA
jgi:hypothetical protein